MMHQPCLLPELHPSHQNGENDLVRTERFWREHEHTAPAVQAEASRLIHQAGSPALAKQAIDAAADDEAPTKPR